MRSSKAQMTSRRGRSRVRRSRSDGSMIDRRQAVKGGSRSRSAAALPAPHGAVFQAGDGEIRGLVGVLRCEGLVDIDAVAGCLAGMQEAIVQEVGRGKDRIGLVVVENVFVDSEVRNPTIEVARGDRKNVG